MLVGFAMRWPRPSFAVASVLDRMTGALGLTDRSFWRRGVMYIGIFHPSNRWPFPAVAAAPDPMGMPGPAVLASLHIGAVEAVGALLERLPAAVLGLVDREIPAGRRMTTIQVGGGEWQRVATTKRAVETLRSGGFVFLAVDAMMANARIETTVCGKAVSWARGGFDLARLTNSPMLPVMTRWRGRKVEIISGEPIPPADASEMIATLAEWLERYLNEHPSELRDLLG
jgi:hypothetical protein